MYELSLAEELYCTASGGQLHFRLLLLAQGIFIRPPHAIYAAGEVPT
jgi:hypothetical protein